MQDKDNIDLLISHLKSMNTYQEVVEFIESAFQNPRRRYFYWIDGIENTFRIRRNGFVYPDNESLKSSLFKFAKDDLGNFLSVKDHCEIVVQHHEFDRLFPLIKSGGTYAYRETPFEISIEYVKNARSVSELDGIKGYDGVAMTYQGELAIEIASMCGNLDLISSAIANGSPPGDAVALAARNNHADCLKLLLESKFSPFGGYKDEADLLSMPKLLGYTNVVSLIESYRKDSSSGQF